MIMVLVKHFLNEEGRAIFPDWVRETREVLKKYPGFVSLQRIQPLNQPEECYMLLSFESMKDLKNWSASDEHKEIMNRLKPYRTQPPLPQIFEIVD